MLSMRRRPASAGIADVATPAPPESKLHVDDASARATVLAVIAERLYRLLLPQRSTGRA